MFLLLVNNKSLEMRLERSRETLRALEWLHSLIMNQSHPNKAGNLHSSTSLLHWFMAVGVPGFKKKRERQRQRERTIRNDCYAYNQSQQIQLRLDDDHQVLSQLDLNLKPIQAVLMVWNDSISSSGLNGWLISNGHYDQLMKRAVKMKRVAV